MLRFSNASICGWMSLAYTLPVRSDALREAPRHVARAGADVGDGRALADADRVQGERPVAPPARARAGPANRRRRRP